MGNEELNSSGMSEEVCAWLSDLVGGVVTRQERSLARREGWYVDLAGANGIQRLFVRVATPGDPANSPEALRHEADCVRQLSQNEIRVAPLLGINLSLNVAAYGRLDGSADLTDLEAADQQAVYERFLEELARVHALGPDDVTLDRPVPRSSTEAALAGLDDLENFLRVSHADPAATSRIPIIGVLGLRWLKAHAPDGPLDAVLVHGDAGTPNFLYNGTQLSGLIDWEWARYGDPMEDLGNAVLHAMFHPSGSWPELLEYYQRQSGKDVDFERVRYYRTHLAIRSVVALATATASWRAHDPIALNKCYRTIAERLTCECLAEHAGFKLEAPAPLEFDLHAAGLHEASADVLDSVVLPNVDSAFHQGRVREIALLVRSFGRDKAASQELTRLERADLAGFLGATPSTIDDGWATISTMVDEGHGIDDPSLLQLLYNQACREEQVFAPVVELFPNVKLRAITHADRT